MSRHTDAYSKFLIQAGETEILRKSASKLERNSPIINGDKINALCRGAIVLLSSSLEAYIKGLGESLLDKLYTKNITRKSINSQLFYHISKDIIKSIQESTDPEVIADKIFNFIDRDACFWSKDGHFNKPIPTDIFNYGFSNPAFKKIQKYFNRFGYVEYKNDLRKNLTTDYWHITNTVDHLVAIRNSIAHGDPYAAKTPSELHELALAIKHFCKSTDDVFSSWCKLTYCTIR